MPSYPRISPSSLLRVPVSRSFVPRMFGTCHAGKGRLQLAFRIDQEVPRGNDLFAALQTAQNGVQISDLGSQLDLARFEIAITEGNEDDLLGA